MAVRSCSICDEMTHSSEWRDDTCPVCNHKGGPRTKEEIATAKATVDAAATARVEDTNSKPSIIGTLSTLGWVLFAMMGLSGVFLISQDGGGILGASLIIAGVFQLSIFLGFSAIIDQLYKINVNTSKPDKSDS
jgi:hypothetical protein